MPDDRAGATSDEQVVLLQAESCGSSEDHRRLSGWSDGTLASDDDASFNKETRLAHPGDKVERPSSSLLSGRRHPGRTGWQKLLRVTLAASAISLILGAVYMVSPTKNLTDVVHVFNQADSLHCRRLHREQKRDAAKLVSPRLPRYTAFHVG